MVQQPYFLILNSIKIVIFQKDNGGISFIGARSGGGTNFLLLLLCFSVAYMRPGIDGKYSDIRLLKRGAPGSKNYQ